MKTKLLFSLAVVTISLLVGCGGNKSSDKKGNLEPHTFSGIWINRSLKQVSQFDFPRFCQIVTDQRHACNLGITQQSDIIDVRVIQSSGHILQYVPNLPTDPNAQVAYRIGQVHSGGQFAWNPNAVRGYAYSQNQGQIGQQGCGGFGSLFLSYADDQKNVLVAKAHPQEINGRQYLRTNPAEANEIIGRIHACYRGQNNQGGEYDPNLNDRRQRRRNNRRNQDGDPNLNPNYDPNYNPNDNGQGAQLPPNQQEAQGPQNDEDDYNPSDEGGAPARPYLAPERVDPRRPRNR